MPSLASAEKTRYISMVQALAHINEYEGFNIGFVGFKDQRQQIIYLTRDHAEIQDLFSSIKFISTDRGRYGACDGNYVHISGKVVRESTGGYFLSGNVKMTTMDHVECKSDGDDKSTFPYK